jgi:uncharacterized protein (TIGR02246 family)
MIAGASRAVACALALAACASTRHTTESSPTDVEDARAVATGIVAADNARELNRVIDFYAPDAALLPPGECAVIGVDAIRARYEKLFARYDPAITTEIEDVTQVGDTVCVRGQNGGRLRGREGVPDRDLEDAYLMLLRRQKDGGWRISVLMWHGTDAEVGGERVR